MWYDVNKKIPTKATGYALGISRNYNSGRTGLKPANDYRKYGFGNSNFIVRSYSITSRGIQKMVENDAYCPDILIQVSAVTSALNSFNKELLACHIHSCVSEDIRAGRDEAVDELVRVLQKLMK